MPNWCYNTLVVTGPEASLAQALSAVADDPSPEGGQDRGTDVKPTALSLEKIEPTPREVLLESALPSIELLFRGPRDGERDDWMTWRNRHWGTKWDVDAEIEERADGMAKLAFDSAWSPPVMAIVSLSAQYPDLEFLLSFDESGNDFSGTRLIKAGAIVQMTDGPSASNLADEFEIHYQVVTGVTGETIKEGWFTIDAADEEAASEFTVMWVLEHDDACDPRLDPSVRIISVNQI